MSRRRGGLSPTQLLRAVVLAILLGCAAPLAGVPAAQAAHAADPAVVLTPTAGPPGSAVTISGTGFGATEVVTVTFDGTLVAATGASAAGSIDGLHVTVPNPATSGPHTVLVRGTSSGQAQSAVFTVTGTPVLMLTPSEGSPGMTVSIGGSGFGASEPVIATFDGMQVGTGATTETGIVAPFTFAVPTPVAAGAHTVTVRGTTSGLAQNVTFTVGGQPTLVLTPNTGSPGSTVSVGGSGFGAGEPVTIAFDGAQVGTGATTGMGALPALTFAVPTPVAAGAHTVTVRGTTSGLTQNATFTVAGQPTLVLTPNAGVSGSAVVVSGSGFGAGEPVTVAFDGAQVAAGTSSPTGAIATLTFSVPTPVAAGAHTVTVRGTTSGLTQNVTFTAQAAPALTLSASSGLPGSTVVVSGSGFSAGETIILQFDTTVVRAATAGADGTFGGGVLTAPSGTAGGHTIAAHGQSSGLTVSVPFTISASLSVSPDSGPPGTAAVVNGSGFSATEVVTVSVDGAQVAAGTANGAGALTTLPVNVPNPLAAGAHTLVARGTASGVSQSTTFTVTGQPALLLTPNAGAPGSVVTVSGSGFGATEAVTVSFDGAQVTAGTSNATGAVSGLSVSVPNPLAAGVHTVVVRGTTSGLTGSTTFTAQTAPTLTLSVASGLPGSTVTISGRGFGANQTITLQLDTAILATAQTDASGTFGGSAVAVPATTAGSHTITARGQQSGLTASAPFTVISPAVLRLAPASVAVGSRVTVAVAGFSAGELVVLTARGQTLATANADGSGAIGALSLVAPMAPGGLLTVTAHGTSSGRTATATVTITPTLAASATSTTAGLSLALTGRGFGANEPIALTINGVSLSTAAADATGSFVNVGVVVPASLPAGSYTLAARSVSSGRTASVRVAVARPLVLSLARATTIAGGLVTVSGRGFAANSPITLSVDGVALLATTSDARGVLQVSVVLPPRLGDGAHTLSAQAGTTGRRVQTALTIVAPQARVASTFHLVGTALPRLGAPLLSLNGILTIQAEAGTGDFTGHARLLLEDGKTVLAPAGWLVGHTLRLRLDDGGVLLVGQGAAVSANRVAGTFITERGGQTLGFWVATRATTADVVHYSFTSQTSSGPDAGLQYDGTLDLLGDAYGGLIGFLRLPTGAIDPVSGQQVNGNLNMRIIVRAGTPFFVVGTASGRGFSGILAGPLAGDRGSWTARSLGAALPLPHTAFQGAAATLSVSGDAAGFTMRPAAWSSSATVLPLWSGVAVHRALAPGTQTFHLAGTLLPRVGAPLVHIDGILYVQTGATAGSTTMTVSINRTLIPARGSVLNNRLTVRFVYHGMTVTGQALAVSGHRFAGQFTQGQGGQTLGFWAATQATTPDVVHYAFSAQISTGPDRGTHYDGTLDLLADTYGGVIGFLRLPSGPVYAVNGQQVNGTLNMVVIVRAGTPFFVVGTALRTSYRGMVAGPLAGDRGSWTGIR